jgi:hypothetical protein
MIERHSPIMDPMKTRRETVGFILKIYMLGLVAFVPSPDGKQMTVLLVDARGGFQASDGSVFPPHYPILLASAAHCQGDCTREVAKIGPHLYSRTPDPVFPSSPNPSESLRRLVKGGGAWVIGGSQISFIHPAPAGRAMPGLQIVRDRRPSQARGELAPLPANAREKEDFSWVADMAKAAPESAEIDPDCLARRPRKCRVAGRLTVAEGYLSTHKLAAFLPPTGGGGIAEFKFRSLAADTPVTGEAPAYTQALADWTAVEIHVPACDVTFVTQSLDGKGHQRRMKLSPATCDGKGVVEVAMLNLPDPSRRDTANAHVHEDPKGEGTHFEFFYELSKHQPAPRQRPVPQVTGEYLPVAKVGQDKESSPLLERLGLPRAGTYSRPICPQTVFAAPQ